LGELDHLRGDGAEEEIAEAADTTRAHHDVMGANFARAMRSMISAAEPTSAGHESHLRFPAKG
jgi:hypothetical protein